MIDYEHIPAHLRLSDRHLIVPNYPGDAEWWQQEEKRARYIGAKIGVPNTREMTDIQRRMLELIKSGVDTNYEIGKQMGIDWSQVRRAADGLTRFVPLYEDADLSDRGYIETTYGLLA